MFYTKKNNKMCFAYIFLIILPRMWAVQILLDLVIRKVYLTCCTFSFEFKESSLSDTKCLIQDLVSPHW